MWEFTSPRTIVLGYEALDYLEEIRGKRAFLVTDEGIRRLGYVDLITHHLNTAGLHVKVFDRVEPEPSLETIEVGAKEARDYGPDWIVALGGGSSIDAAKAIWVRYERPDIAVSEISPLLELGLRKKARLLCIPTTSGTGSDVTWATVITNQRDRRKMELASRELVTDIALIDPELTLTMPHRLIADTGLDALSHGIEAYVSQWRNDFSDALAMRAIQLIFKYLPRAYHNPNDRVAREKMHNAATMAGWAFSNSQCGIVHAMAHAIGALFKIPHGKVIAISLPYVMKYNARDAEERYVEIANALNIGADTSKNTVERLITATKTLIAEVEEPQKIEDVGILWGKYQEHLDQLVERAFESTTTMVDPRVPNAEDLIRLFTYAFHGKDIDF